MMLITAPSSPVIMGMIILPVACWIFSTVMATSEKRETMVTIRV